MLTSFVKEGKENTFEAFAEEIRDVGGEDFKSLLYLGDIKDDVALNEYVAYRTKLKESTVEARTEEEGIDPTDDILIADPYFASLLNRDREIVVGEKVYKYTEKGVFFTDTANYEALVAAVATAPADLPEGTTNLGGGVQLFNDPVEPCDLEPIPMPGCPGYEPPSPPPPGPPNPPSPPQSAPCAS